MSSPNSIRELFRSVPKRYYTYLAIGAGALLLLFLVAVMVIMNKREGLLLSAIEKAKQKAKADYAIELSIKDASFSGLRSVSFEEVSLIPSSRDTLVEVKHLEVAVKVFPLLAGKVKLADVHLNDGSISFIKRDSVSNYDFLFNNEPKSDSARITDNENSTDLHLDDFAERMLNSIFYKIPDNLLLRNFLISYTDDSLAHQILIPKADMDNGQLMSDIQIDKGKALWHLNGDLHPGKKELFFRLTAEDGNVVLPLIEEKYGLAISFDTLETHLKRVDRDNGEQIRMEGSWGVSNLNVNHWRIASNDVVLPKARMSATIVVGNNSISLEEESKLQLAHLTAFPSVRLQLKPHKTYSLGVHIPEIPAQEAFDSFPKGLFTSLEGIKVDGKIGYDFNVFLDETVPDSVELSSEMYEEGFRITRWGKTDLSKINHRFIYTPEEQGAPVRNIIVGPENPDFTPLDEISPNLKNAVLTAEDPSFYSHEGFVPKAIRASIATNFKEKAFKRGGSTISMQLVKNVFLDREKTLARKIEEMLLVWLIEHNDIVSKDRMFEVYLNIIEWGGNVYGIGEASRYYFLKKPSQLSVGESIFLASIVPRPKSGLYRFDQNGIIKDFLRGYYRLIGGLMARRGLVPVDPTHSYGFYSVTLRNAVRPVPAEVDTLESPAMDLEKELEEAKKLLEDLFSSESQE